MEQISIRQSLIEKLHKSLEDYKTFSNLIKEVQGKNQTKTDRIRNGALAMRLTHTTFHLNTIADILVDVFKEDLTKYLSKELLEERRILYESINAYNVEDGRVKFPKEMEEFLAAVEKNENKTNSN